MALVLGLGAIGILWIVAQNHASLAHNAAFTTGIVTAMQSSVPSIASDDAVMYCAYTVRGRHYMVRLRDAGYHAGETLRVRYAVEDPYIAEVLAR